MKRPCKTLVCMDSGVGGLAVLKRFAQQLPHSPYVFLGDTAWMPYGEKPLADVRERVLAVHQWLQQTYPIAAFVLACNTATVAAYDVLESLHLPYPVLEPVKTTAEWVNQHVPTSHKIGILATPGTVSGGRYLRYLDPDRPVQQVSCSGLASLIESGVCEGPELEDMLRTYLNPLLAWQADALILGCTHYSLVQPAIRRLVGPDITLIDSAEVLANVATPIIERLQLGQGSQQLMVTGDGRRFQEAIAQLPLPEFQGHPVCEMDITAESSLTPH